jgi:tetratricopeptide (TPR) repeat protein
MSKKRVRQASQQTAPNKPKQKELSVVSSTQNSFSSWWPALIAIVITFLCFSTAINNEFVNWDDDRNFYENPLIQNINKENFWDNTKQIFTSDVIGNYNPLTIWTFALEKIYLGFEKTHLWHLNNVLLHLLCVFLVFRISTFLGIGWRGAFFIALLFGIHPLRVESVAWVTERKDVLFGAFYFGALLQYVKYKHDASSVRWVWITIFFILSLFSKIQAVSLPLSLLAVDYYLDQKFSFKAIFNKIPFFLMSLGFGILGILMLKEQGSLATVEDNTDFNFIQRLFVGSYSFVIYLIKLVLPFRMSPLYPYPNYFPWYFYPSMLIAPLTLYVLYKSHMSGKKAIFFGIIFFIVNIIFLLQILGAGQGFIADRFTYIAYFGLFFTAGYYIDKWTSPGSNHSAYAYGLAGIFMLAFAFMTFQQNKVWKNSATLWTHVLKYYQATTLPYGNRANYYRDKKMFREALTDYNATISMKDNQPQAYNSRARLFFEIAKGPDTLLLALNDYTKAISYDSTDGEFWVNRGATYARLGNIEKAIEDLNKGLKLKPDHAVGYLNRSIMYHNINRTDLALADIESYLKLNPYNADLWFEKGRALRLLNRPQDAISAYSEALKYQSNNTALYYHERARTYADLKMLTEAKNDLQQAINMQYKAVDPALRSQLGL